MVVADKLGVTKLPPVAKAVPPVAFAYQEIVPELAVAWSVTEPLPHLDAGVVPVNIGIVFIVATTAVLAELQVSLSVST